MMPVAIGYENRWNKMQDSRKRDEIATNEKEASVQSKKIFNSCPVLTL